MSRRWGGLDPMVRRSIQMQGPRLSEPGWKCGCAMAGAESVDLCQYHEGYADGFEVCLEPVELGPEL